MSKRLTGLNPLAYLGVEPTHPSDMYMSPESPTPTDVRNFNIGDFWINTETLVLWVLVSQDGGVATWIPLSAGGGATTNFNADTGTATEFGGAISILGDGVNTNTSASGSTLNVNLNQNLTVSNLRLTGIGIEGVVQTDINGDLFADNGSNGQVLIGGGTAPQWTNITEGANISIVNGPNSIIISASGAGGGGTVNFLTDNTTATETGGDITIAGGNNITTNGLTPNTVTIDLTGTTNHAVQVGNASGSLTSLGLGTDGEVLQGITGGNPTFAALNAGAGISITTGPGSITITNTGGGGGGGGVIRTPFFASSLVQTWTKNVATKYVEVWGWCGGGGGGSGNSITLNNQGGAGAGSGSFFRFKAPAEFFGATEDVKVGFGGTGGASVTSNANGNDGTDGGVSYFGNIRVPLVTNNTVANATVTSLMQAGAGGGGFKQVGFAFGYSGGVFTDDAGMILNSGQNNFQYGVPQPNTTGAAFANFQKGGGGGSFDIGVDGLSTGGLLIYGTSSNGSYGLPGRGSFGFVYMLGTSGGQGGSLQSGTYHDGGKGGDVLGFDTTTVLSAGGAAGIAGGATAGIDGTNSIDPGSGLNGSGGLVFGGTGGGGGASDPNNGGKGGDGGFPGGGGGGGGSASPGRPSGAGGDGADGFVIVLEWM